jgi:hypothetical protein
LKLKRLVLVTSANKYLNLSRGGIA